ncbi:hypothetical protein [Mesobacillus zeae]|uniref:DUF2178 domain-containing protein n=1 Tax=Mesobacillus zeae TaxID=1917180 RepID=A0A398B175_9BACI|nr:hypothetical protein [Mesobacillus zeae]RID83575.1 hypothetical protein D1970_15490 [Mesobacillus zeae]
MNNRKIFYIVWAFLIGCILFGGFLGIYTIGKATGEYSYELAIPVIGGTVIGSLFIMLFSRWKKKRNGNVPQIDERTYIMLQRYFMIVLYVVLVGSGAALIILYSIGVRTIETGILIVCMMGLYMSIIFGAFVAKRL